MSARSSSGSKACAEGPVKPPTPGMSLQGIARWADTLDTKWAQTFPPGKHRDGALTDMANAITDQQGLLRRLQAQGLREAASLLDKPNLNAIADQTEGNATAGSSSPATDDLGTRQAALRARTRDVPEPRSAANLNKQAFRGRKATLGSGRRARFFIGRGGDMSNIQADIEARLAETEPEVEVLLAEVVGGDLVRLFIDHPKGVSLDLCERVTKQLPDIREQYALEVSSPGTQRPLTKPEHFRRYLGRKAKVRTRDAKDGHKPFTGELLTATDDAVTVAAATGVVSIAYADIHRSNLVGD